jgi:dUTP pyrophosphatase
MSLENLGGFNPAMKEEILKQFEKIKQEAGIEPDENYLKEIEELYGLSFEGLEEDLNKMIKTKSVGVELIHPDAVFPRYAYPTDSGFDLHSTEDLEIGPFGRVLVPTGLKIDIPEGTEIQVRPKSGLAIKQGLTVLNTPGTVDQGYTGEIQVIVFNTNNYSVMIPKGMKVAQAVLCPVLNGGVVNLQLVNEVGNKDRGNNGFGSTGI